MITEVTTHYSGYEGSLKKLHADLNNHSLPYIQRLGADKARKKIMNQLADKKLMSLRERLIKASRAEDEQAIIKITKLIRDHRGEDQETGLYE